MSKNEIIGNYYPVLDKGFISLVDTMGSDQAIEQAARVSYGVDTRQLSETRGLLRHLMRSGHTSPFEMAEFKFHCSMPIFVARQWIRHRTASVNEYSGRYSKMPKLFYVPDQDQVAYQSKDNKQGRSENSLLSKEHYEMYKEDQRRNRRRISNTYDNLIGDDVSRELARMDLPLSTYTQWYWKIDLHNLFHFLTLRCDSHAQYEIRVFAQIMAAMVQKVCPLAYEAWRDYKFNAVNFSYAERRILSSMLQTSCVSRDFIRSGFLVNQCDAVGMVPREVKGFKDKVSKLLEMWDREASDEDPMVSQFATMEPKPPEFFHDQWNDAAM